MNGYERILGEMRPKQAKSAHIRTYPTKSPKSMSVTTTTEEIKRPAVKYYGGKFKIADWIISFFPPHEVYTEPFGGAGSVLLKKKPARAEIYNDLSSEIVNLFSVLRDKDGADELIRLLHLTPYSRAEWLNCYEKSEDPIEQARRTVVLCMMSHNTAKVMNRQKNGFRNNSSGHHRLPVSFTDYTDHLQVITRRLKQVIIENRPAMEVMEQHDSYKTLHYVDPPYLRNLRKEKGIRYAHELTHAADHEQLATFLKTLKGYVILSGYACEEYTEWYEKEGWVAFSKSTVSGASLKGKSTRQEVIWLNPAASRFQLQLFARSYE